MDPVRRDTETGLSYYYSSFDQTNFYKGETSSTSWHAKHGKRYIQPIVFDAKKILDITVSTPHLDMKYFSGDL